jgi:hypothetical protein
MKYGIFGKSVTQNPLKWGEQAGIISGDFITSPTSNDDVREILRQDALGIKTICRRIRFSL